MSAFRLSQTATVLRRGGVIACPTEAVWGLSCDPLNRSAVARLLELKHRSVHKGLILIVAELRQLEDFVDPACFDNLKLAEQQRVKAGGRPTSWLVPKNEALPYWISGAHQSVAVRVSSHPVVVELCRQFNGPIISTSANSSGCQPARYRFQVYRYFNGSLDAVAPGAVGGQSAPSTIIDLQTQNVVRGAA